MSRLAGFQMCSCTQPRVVGEYTTEHYRSEPTPAHCPYCHATMRAYTGVSARAAEDSRGPLNAFIGSRKPDDTRVLKCDGCSAKWTTRMSNAELADVEREP